MSTAPAEAAAGAAAPPRRPRISPFRRLLWHVNRSPLAHLVKAGVAAAHPSLKRRRRAAARALDAPPPVAGRAEALRRDGWARLDDLVDGALLEAVGAAGAAKLARAAEARAAQLETHKSFWVRLLDEDLVDGALASDHPFVRFGLQPALIGLAATRFGELPLLESVLLTLSEPGDAALGYSQLWHRDHDDTVVLKAFVYLTDVAAREDGPFTFLPGAGSDRVGYSLRSHLADAAFAARSAGAAPVEMVAPRLSTFAVETSRCWHMGSRVAPGHRRLMLTLTYVTSPRIYPGWRPRVRETAPLAQRERMVLGLA
jgi:hypothetical protein